MIAYDVMMFKLVSSMMPGPLRNNDEAGPALDARTTTVAGWVLARMQGSLP